MVDVGVFEGDVEPASMEEEVAPPSGSEVGLDPEELLPASGEELGDAPGCVDERVSVDAASGDELGFADEPVSVEVEPVSVEFVPGAEESVPVPVEDVVGPMGTSIAAVELEKLALKRSQKSECVITGARKEEGKITSQTSGQHSQLPSYPIHVG